MFTRSRNSGHTSVQNLVKFSQFQMGVAARIGMNERSASVATTGRPVSRGGGYDEYGRSIGGLQPISVTRELAFGAPVEAASGVMRRRMKTCNAGCFGRMALVLGISLLAVGVYVVRHYERMVDEKLKENYERDHPLKNETFDQNMGDSWNGTVVSDGEDVRNVTEMEDSSSALMSVLMRRL